MNLQTCELRDIQGLYVKARRGEIANCMGISSPYESPLNLEIIVNTGSDSIEVCVNHCYSIILIYIHIIVQPVMSADWTVVQVRKKIGYCGYSSMPSS